jgi:type II secretory pathway component PulL
MASRGFILFVDDETRWRIAPASGDAPPADVESSTEQVAESLRQMGYRGEGIVLAVPSTWCMTATINVAQIPARDYKAMTYRLEEQLPLAAEAVVADFIVRDGRALAVCARAESLRATIAALEAQGIAVQSAAPAMMLAAQELARDGKGEQVLVLGEASHINLIAIRDGVATSWALVSPDPRDVALHLDVISLEFQGLLALRACDVGPDVLRALVERGNVRELPPGTVEQAARRQARNVLGGRSAAWGELRRGQLAGADPFRSYRKALNAALAAVAVLLLACSGAMLWRAHQYDSRTRANEAALATEFRRAFPGWAVPTNVKTVIESERRKALALAQDGAGGRQNSSAVRTLHDVLSQLPGDEPWSIQRMSFDDASFQIEGKLRAYEALDRFAAAVRRAGMSVTTPESRKGADGFWSFTLRGSQPTAAGRTDRE